jgi:hypothetical protein
MLRITRSEANDLTRTLKLEGKLTAPWISELKSACGGFYVSLDRVCLDLAGLTFIDMDGALFLRSLIHDGARVIACSAFVAEMLYHERS